MTRARALSSAGESELPSVARATIDGSGRRQRVVSAFRGSGGALRVVRCAFVAAGAPTGPLSGPAGPGGPRMIGSFCDRRRTRQAQAQPAHTRRLTPNAELATRHTEAAHPTPPPAPTRPSTA